LASRPHRCGFIFTIKAGTHSKARPIRRLRTLRVVDEALARQRKGLNLVKRENWTEADLGNLPEGEPDIFDRKSGLLFNDRSNFFNSVAKALSAFANSGGGSLILGVTDNGTPDGLPPREGKTSIREWLEQKIPQLLDYPLADFRVHTVIRSDISAIPIDNEVIVIDVGDSAAAPHQSTRDRIYYRREGGHSKPVPHFYLELLRQRLTNPVLEFELSGLEQLSAIQHENGIAISWNSAMTKK
jgi:Putative DNA-binding domain